MILYFAGSEPKSSRQILSSVGVKNVLISFFHFRDRTGERIKELLSTFDRVFLDSGGFSARIKGVPIEVEDYKNYLLKVKNDKLIYANLDLKTYEETKKNQEYLESYGLKPLPVYHFSEYNSKDKEVLLEYIKKYDYIAIGGVVGSRLNSIEKSNYLNYIFRHTKDKIKVHGFGITDYDLISTYPFYSVDSTGWQQRMRFGSSYLSKPKKIIKIQNKINHYSKNLIGEVEYVKQMEVDITNLWNKRGIIWK